MSEAVIYAADAFAREPDIFDLPVHPLAESWAMMIDGELDDLADDISANGLHHPLVVYQGQLLDGRNRREACRRAGVQPDVIELDPSKDPVAFVLSENNNRRHRTEGARAMAIALVDQFVSHGGPRVKGESQQVFSKNLLGQISRARLVIAEVPELVEHVKQGGSLNEAYNTAQLKRRQRQERQQRLDELRKRHPDLAAKVDRREWTLDKALEVVYREELVSRQEKAGQHEQDALARFVEALESPRALDFDSVQSDASEPPAEQFQAQQVVLGTLHAMAAQLAELKDRPPVGGRWQDTYSDAVQSATRAIISNAKALGKAHQPLKAESEVQRRAHEDQVRLRRAALRHIMSSMSTGGTVGL